MTTTTATTLTNNWSPATAGPTRFRPAPRSTSDDVKAVPTAFWSAGVGLVVENLFTVFVPEQASRFLPFVAGNNLLGIEGEGAFAESARLALTRPQDALVFGAYAVAALVLGTALLYRRDAS